MARLFVMNIRNAMTLCLSLTASSAYADYDCDVVTRLLRVHGALERIHLRDKADEIASDIAIMVQEARHLDVERVKQAFRDASDSDDVNAVVDLSVLHTIVVTLAQRDQIQLLHNQLHSQRAQDRLDAAARVLRGTYCTENAVTVSGSGDGRNVRPEPGQGVATEKTPRRTFKAPSPLQAIIVLLALISGSFAAYKLVIWLKERAAYRKRQSKRFPTNLAAGLRCGAACHDIQILDLSCHGAKMRNDGTYEPKLNSTVDCYVDETWCKAQIAWANQLYFGVTFQKALNVTNVRTLATGVQTHSIAQWQKEKATLA